LNVREDGMKKLSDWLNEYSESHQNTLNKTIHWICVPSIVFSIVLLLWSIPSPGILTDFGLNYAYVVMFLAVFYYVLLSPTLAIGMALIFSLMGFFAQAIQLSSPIPVWSIGLIVFAIAWIGQFYGHHVEGKKPSFLKDIQFLLIGPIWLLQFIYKRVGIPL
jgi:uncharacterized membrane protein YGL010W